MKLLGLRWLVIFGVVLLPACLASAATPISSTFDTDAEGWTATPGAATVAHVASGGNPDGFLSSTDTDPTTPVVIAPAKFLGNLSAYAGGMLSYDMKVLDPTTPVTSVGDGLGRVQLNGGGSNATFTYLPSPPLPSPDEWRTFVVPLTAAAFNTTQANWQQVLSNVTNLDVIIQHGTTVGMDNFQLTPAPDLSALIVFTGTGFSFEILNPDVSAGQVPFLYIGNDVAANKEGELYLNGVRSTGGGETRDAIIKSSPGGPSEVFAYLNSPVGFLARGPWGMHFDANGDLIGIVVLEHQTTGTVIARPLVRITGFEPVIPSAFQESSGQVVMEAEHYDGNISSSGHSWTLETAKAGFAGTGYMNALPNSGLNINSGYTTTSPQLLFNVNFTTTGTYYVWVRGQADSGTDDSCHAGIDGTGPASADRLSGFSTGWTWKRDTMDAVPATLVISTPGLHTIHLWMREDGLRVDRLLLRTSSSSTAPSGTGPAESPRTP